MYESTLNVRNGENPSNDPKGNRTKALLSLIYKRMLLFKEENKDL